MSRRESMTLEDIQAAQKLRAIWDLKKKDLGLTQYKIADKYGITQGMVTHYLNGHQGLNIKTVLMFATELGVDPRDIYPGLFSGIQLCPVTSGQEQEFLALYAQAPPDIQAMVRGLLERFSNKS